MALTEVHLGCTRDEQLRWLVEAWRAAESCYRSGVDVRAVTLWSAFGACDWTSLLTRDDGHYEVGAFDARSTPPRPTALSRVARALASGEPCEHPALSRTGWWRQPSRVLYPQPSRQVRASRARKPADGCLLAVGDGLLSERLDALAALRGLHLLRATSLSAARAQLRVQRPWAVVLDASDGEGYESQLESGRLQAFAHACLERGAQLALCSSDRVFDGREQRPYVESDPTGASCAQGRALQRIELALQPLADSTLIVRTGPLLDPAHPDCRARSACNSARGVALDEIVSPTLARHALDALLDLLLDRERGVWHLANQGSLSVRELVARLADELGAASRVAVAVDRLHVPEPPDGHPGRHVPMRVLASERAALLPPLERALSEYLAAVGAAAPRRATRAVFGTALERADRSL